MESTSNRWLGLTYKWLVPLALVAAIGVAAVTVISARSDDGQRYAQGQRFLQDGEGSSEHDCEGRKGHGRLAARFSELAELVGTDSDGLKAALGEGKTLAEVAEQNGVAVGGVIDSMAANLNERIDGWVADGKLTAEEAESKKSEAAERIADVVNNGFDRENSRAWGKGRWRGIGGRLKSA